MSRLLQNEPHEGQDDGKVTVRLPSAMMGADARTPGMSYLGKLVFASSLSMPAHCLAMVAKCEARIEKQSSNQKGGPSTQSELEETRDCDQCATREQLKNNQSQSKAAGRDGNLK